MSGLYERTNYTADINFIINEYITEYDMKSANTSIMKSLKLVSDDKIDELNNMTKKDRNIAVGNMMKHDKKFSKKLRNGFKIYRKKFFKANNIDDEDILSIKTDAIFIVGRVASKLKFDSVIFEPDNKYTSFYKLNGLEFYYRYHPMKKHILDVKGINDEVLERHDKYILKFLKEIFKLTQKGNKELYQKRIIDFMIKYKKRQLPVGYYREFNRESLFRLHQNNVDREVGVVDISKLDNVNIHYNYMYLLIPLFGTLY